MDPPGAPSPAPKPSTINPAFRYLGIPASWISRTSSLRLPSRNTSAFLLVSTSLVSLYLYDRDQCRKIREAHVQRIRHLSESLVLETEAGGKWLPRKVNVYGARVPEDVDVDRAAQWFKKYVKPILVAAAIDYTIHNGTSPGALGRKIATDIRDQRIIKAAQEKDGYKNPVLSPGMPGYREWHAEQSKLEGGTLILGRGALKEYLWGLQHGYKETMPLDGLDDDERFAKHLEEEGIFDAPSTSGAQSADDETTMPSGLRSVNQELQTNGEESIDLSSPLLPEKEVSTSPQKPLGFFGFLSRSTPSLSPKVPPTDNTSSPSLAPIPIPPQPPLLLVPFVHPIGIRWWPLKIYRFFNKREQVSTGAETAMKLVEAHSRSIEPPTDLAGINQWPKPLNSLAEDPDFTIKFTGSSDLDFLAPEADEYIRRSYKKAAQNILRDREYFRRTLKERLVKARQAADESELERTADATDAHNETQLRQEAFQKEKKWRDDLEGWSIVRRGSGVCWTPDMEHALRVYTPKSSSDSEVA